MDKGREESITTDADETKKMQCISDSLVITTNTDRNVVTHSERQISNEVMDEVEGEKGQKNPDEKMILDGATSTSTTKKNAIWNDQWFDFKEIPTLEEIKIDYRSTLKWCPNFISEEESDALFTHLMEELNFEHTQVTMHGDTFHLPRLQSWFAEEELVYKDLFQKQKQHVWTSPMRKLKAQLETQLGVEFHYCLVNLYRDGNDHISFHADNAEKDVIIASLSLGATRRFLLRHLRCFGKILTQKSTALTRPETKEYEFSLTNGSLIVMSGGTQLYWKHSIPKEIAVDRPRINLTFRTIKDK